MPLNEWKILIISRNGKFNYIRENWFLMSWIWFDYVYDFDIDKWIWKIILNNKSNYLNEEWILIWEWKDNLWEDIFTINKNIKIPKKLYRISRIENLSTIIEYGILSRILAYKYFPVKNNSYDNIQDRRSSFWVYNLHKYVPLFFSKYPPMMYSTKIKENISNQMILIFDWSLILEKWVIFSDVSLAYSNISVDNIFDDLGELNKINYSIFNQKWWENDINIRKKKWAEVLIKNRVDFRWVKEIIYFDKKKKNEIESILKENKFNITITYNNYGDYK